MNIKLLATSFSMLFAALGAEINYDIQDIGTIQTCSSTAIDLNNNGQILGWYNIDGTNDGKYFFLRENDGSFYTLPATVSMNVNWRFLTEDGKVYGTNDGNKNFAVLFMWDKDNGAVKLGNLPGKEVMGVNSKGEVLIKSISEIQDGKSVTFPVTWHNGVVRKLGGLKGNLGIESEQSYGVSINNSGDVVGESLVNLIYKNNQYKKLPHVTLWKNGKAEDLHYSLPKSEESQALAINDRGDVLINIKNQKFIVKIGGSYTNVGSRPQKITNNGDSYCDILVLTETTTPLAYIGSLTEQVQANTKSPWASVTKIVKVNDKGEIIAQGKTIYGEDHAMILKPVFKSE